MNKTYTVQWGYNEESVTTTEELDTILDRIWSEPGDDGAPYIVTVYDPDERDPKWNTPAAVQGAIGDPRGLGWVLSNRGLAYEPDIPAPPTPENPWDWSWDFGGQRTAVEVWRIRLRHETVRALLRAFLTNDEVPAAEWGLEDPDPTPKLSHEEQMTQIGSLNEHGVDSPHYEPPVMPRGPGPLAKPEA